MGDKFKWETREFVSWIVNKPIQTSYVAHFLFQKQVYRLFRKTNVCSRLYKRLMLRVFFFCYINRFLAFLVQHAAWVDVYSRCCHGFTRQIYRVCLFNSSRIGGERTASRDDCLGRRFSREQFYDTSVAGFRLLALSRLQTLRKIHNKPVKQKTCNMWCV